MNITSQYSIPLTTKDKDELSLITSGTIPLIHWSRKQEEITKSAEDCMVAGFQCFRMEGSPDEIMGQLEPQIPSILAVDIFDLLRMFCQITGETKPLLELSVVTDNRCRRFHTDFTDYRMLCTYSGPATLWITDPTGALDERKGIDNVPDGFQTNRAEEQDVLIFAGAMAPNIQCSPLLHKSPPLTNGQRRLMLRIDTQSFASILKGFTT